MSRTVFGVFACLIIAGSFLVTVRADAKTSAKPFEVSGWIPYWRAATGTADVLPHLENMSAVMPFGYIVQNDGTLSDAFGFSATSSTSTANVLLTVARARKVRVIPTVMWSNSAATHRILSNGPLRRALEDSIVALVQENGFDGIDIDFENKQAKTKAYFSLFLKGLYQRMGKKLVYCSIEARTPPASAFAVVPSKLEYTNDFSAINSYCDRVQFMTYDQRSVDLTLNDAAGSTPYSPIADPKWVEKAIRLASQTISKQKILIGVATYGYEYDLLPQKQGYIYDLDWAFNPRYALDLAAQFGITPTRNSAGELSFIYTPTTTPATAGIGANPQHLVWWSDASAVSDKVRLAQTLGVRGVAIFKLDGGEDPALWDILPAKSAN